MAVEAFELEIKDGISGPANEIKASLTELRGSIKGLSLDIIDNQKKQLALKTTGAKEQAKALGDEIAKQRLELKRLNVEAKSASDAERDLAKATKDTGKESGVMAGLVAGATAAFVQMAEQAARAIADFAVGLVKLVGEASTFRVHMTNAFAVFRGTAAEGQRTYEMVRGLSRLLPIPREEAMKQAQELLALNLQGENRTRNTIQAVANAQAALGDEAAGKLKSIITAAQSTTQAGRFRGVFAPTREELAAIGTSYGELSAVLAKQLGKSNEETMQLLRFGRISAAQGIDALNATVTKGRIGEAARAAMYEPAKVFQSFKDNIFDLFSGFNLRPVMEQLRVFADIFNKDSEAGKGLKVIMDSIFGGGGAGLAEGVKRLRLAFLQIEIAIVRSIILFAPLIQQVKKLGESKTAMDLLALSVKAVAFAFQTAANNILITVAAISKLLELVDKMRAMKFGDVGKDMATGLQQGLAAKGDGLLAAGVQAAGALLSGVRKGLDAHSPSVKMKELGRFAGEGFKLGVADTGMTLEGGTLRVDTRSLQPAAAKAGRSVNMGGITLQVTGVSGAEQLPAMLEPLFADLLERVAAEVA